MGAKGRVARTLLIAGVLSAAVVVGVVVAVLGGSGAAWAHAELVGSDPAEGAVVAQAPAEVRLTFSEAVVAAQSSVRLGTVALPVRQPAGQPTTLLVELTGTPVPAGQVVLVWRSVSADDGHPETGTLRFRLGATGASPSAPAADASASSPPPEGPSAAVRALTVAVRVVGYLALAVFLGGLLFVALLWPAGAADPATRRMLATACALGVASALSGIWVQAAYANQLPLAAALRPGPLGQVLDTGFGRALAARALLWLLAAIVLSGLLHASGRAPRSAGWRIGALVVALGLLRTVDLTGHAGEGPWWAAALDLAHLTALAAWLGGLAVLLAGVLPRRRVAELAAVVPGFSRIALASVLVLAGTGVALAVRLVGSWHELTHSRYGLLLLVKLACFGLVLAAAQRSKTWVGRRLALAVVLRGDRLTVRPFVYSVAAETVLLLAVVTAAGLLVTADPGR